MVIGQENSFKAKRRRADSMASIALIKRRSSCGAIDRALRKTENRTRHFLGELDINN
jgi:hypothetical protein